MDTKRRGGSFHEVLDLFDTLGKRGNFDLLAPDASEKFLASIQRMFTEGRGQPQFSFGKRVEAMFEFVVASLGKCKMVKQEDAGAHFMLDTKIKHQPADYAVVTGDGRHILIEVKNHHASPQKPWSIRSSDLLALRRYALLTGRPLFFAVFWSWPRIWTLVPDDCLVIRSGKARLKFEDAYKTNYMSKLLGDVLLGTTPPLKLRVVADTDKPRSIGTDGHVQFTIGDVELWCGSGGRIDRPLERRIAWYLLFYGKWDALDPEPNAIVENGELIAVEMDAVPEEESPGQNFQIVGALSMMISKHYDSLTLKDGQVAMLRPGEPPDQLGVAIPKDYKGEALPLWILHIQPSGESRGPHL